MEASYNEPNEGMAAEHYLPVDPLEYMQTRGTYMLHPGAFAPSASVSGGSGWAAPSHLVARQSERLQQLLSRRLGAELVASRKGAGTGDVTYIEGWRAIELANEVLGFNGWSSEVKDDRVMSESQNPETLKWDIVIKATVRVWIRDGTSHEDVGYGKMENSRSKADAFEKAHKEAVTDGLKRALRQFGNVLGNCLYDKNYLGAIKNMKVQKPKILPSELFHLGDGMPAAPPSPERVAAPVSVPAAPTAPVAGPSRAPQVKAPATEMKPVPITKPAPPSVKRDTFPPQPKALPPRAGATEFKSGPASDNDYGEDTDMDYHAVDLSGSGGDAEGAGEETVEEGLSTDTKDDRSLDNAAHLDRGPPIQANHNQNQQYRQQQGYPQPQTHTHAQNPQNSCLHDRTNSHQQPHQGPTDARGPKPAVRSTTWVPGNSTANRGQTNGPQPIQAGHVPDRHVAGGASTSAHVHAKNAVAAGAQPRGPADLATGVGADIEAAGPNGWKSARGIKRSNEADEPSLPEPVEKPAVRHQPPRNYQPNPFAGGGNRAGPGAAGPALGMYGTRRTSGASVAHDSKRPRHDD